MRMLRRWVTASPNPPYTLHLKSMRGALTDHPKIDPADQIRAERLGGADGVGGLPQRTDIRSERHDAAEHRGNRAEGGDLAGAEHAEQRDDQQYDAAGDRRLGSQNNLPASLRD